MSVTIASRAGGALGSTLTVDITSPTGTLINQRLRGGLHPFGPWTVEREAAKAHASGVMNVHRHDKFLSCTPIKAGAPDATHPTLGLSGLWSYDTQVIVRTIVDIASQGAGTELYLGLDSIPQILGGSVAPFTGAWLDGSIQYGLAGFGSFASGVPSSYEDYATMCVDLIDIIRTLDLVEIVYCGVGNEPDGSYWDGTFTQFCDHYAAIWDAIKAYDPTLKVGGPEVVDPITNYTTWMHAFLVYGQANGCPPDFLSFHNYYNNAWTLAQVCAKIEASKATLGWTDPLDLINGEWGKGNGPEPPFGTEDTTIEIGDFAAAAVAQELMEMQRLGIDRGIHLKNAFFLGEDTFGSGVVNELGSWATGNVFRLWQRMGDAEIIEHELTADPGITALTALADDDTIYALLSSMHYRRTGTFPMIIGLDGVASGRETTLWMIDREHSNQYEAGLANAELQTVPVANVAGEQVRLTLPARCACLLEIAP